jgi:hypothetical protein
MIIKNQIVVINSELIDFFKNNFTFEPYLHWGNYDKRRLITKFWISSHQLEIERGRYTL